MEKYIAAVDLGTKRITVVVGEKTASGKFKIVAHHEAPSPPHAMRHGEVLNNETMSNVLKSVVAGLKQQDGIDITEVYAGVAGEHIRCIKERSRMTRKAPTVEISEEEIRQMEHDMYNISVKSDSRVLNVIPQRYHLNEGHSVPNPIGFCSHRLEAEFCVLAGEEAKMELIQRTVEKAGLRLKGLFLSPLAAAEAVLYDDDKNMGVAVVDIGGGATSVVVYYDDVVRHVAVIPFGSDVITEDIRQGCAIPSKYAERLKVQYGSCYSDLIKENPTFRMPGAGGGEVSFRMLTMIIEARVAEIMEAVEYEIRQSGYADRLSAGIVLTGGGAKLGELTEFVKYKTGMKARKGEPLFVTSDSDADVQHGDCATVIGLLMKGATGTGYMIKEPVQVEIFPPDPYPGTKPEKDKKPKKKDKSKIIRFAGNLFDFDTFFRADNTV